MKKIKIKGGSIPVAEIKQFLEASYMDIPPEQIGIFLLDKQLSNRTVKVYFNRDIRKLIIIFRGTKEPLDWSNNLIYAMNTTLYNFTNRFRTAQITLNKAMKKYKGYQLEVLGHSQGGLLAHKLGEKSHSNIQLNPAYKGEFQNNNEYIIRSSYDPVSILKGPKNIMSNVLYPEWSKKHNITIPAETINPLTEHSIEILNRLPQDLQIGRNDRKQILRGGYVTYNVSYGFPYN
jgi:hypothetical protein